MLPFSRLAAAVRRSGLLAETTDVDADVVGVRIAAPVAPVIKLDADAVGDAAVSDTTSTASQCARRCCQSEDNASGAAAPNTRETERKCRRPPQGIGRGTEINRPRPECRGTLPVGGVDESEYRLAPGARRRIGDRSRPTVELHLAQITKIDEVDEDDGRRRGGLDAGWANLDPRHHPGTNAISTNRVNQRVIAHSPW